MKTPVTSLLQLPDVLNAVANLPTVGKLAIAGEIVYLDIDDEFIHQGYPMLKKPSIEKPNYFGDDAIGAHITVIYPEENQQIDQVYLGEQHLFSIRGVFSADINLKRYYVLMVKAPTLLQLRRKYGLGEKLLFKDYLIDLHITIGVELIGS